MHASTQHTPTKALRHSRTHVCVMKVRRKVRWKDGYISRLLTRTRAVEQNWQRTFFPFPFRPVLFSPSFFRCFPRFACTLSFVPGILPSRSERSLCLLWAKSSFRCRLAQSRHRGARGGQQELAARLAPQQCCSRLGLATTTLQFHPAAPFVVVSST